MLPPSCHKHGPSNRAGPNRAPMRYAGGRSLVLFQENTVERAFALAEKGSCRTLNDIRSQLKKERCDSVDAHLSGMSIQKQLKGLLAAKKD